MEWKTITQSKMSSRQVYIGRLLVSKTQSAASTITTVDIKILRVSGSTLRLLKSKYSEYGELYEY